jgi:predicted small secreted protein
MTRKLMLFLVLAALAGCATVDGIGRDISGGANRVAGWFG